MWAPPQRKRTGMPLDEPNGHTTSAPGRREDTSRGVIKQNALPRGLADAVLTVLPDNTAVLDQHGTIVAVNAAWKRFARDNGAPALADQSAGQNYLDVCQRASGPSSAGAQEAPAGIRAVRRGVGPSSRSSTPVEQAFSHVRLTWLLRHAGGGHLLWQATGG